MNFRWSNICVLQFLLVLHANALKLVPAERTIVRTNGTTRTISKYYLLPQDDDDPYDPTGSAPSSDNEDFAQFLREFRAKKAAEQNPKKKVDKYKIYIKRKLKHKAPEKPKDGPNISETTTEDLKLPVTEKYKIPIKITEHIKLPVTTTEGVKFRITSEPSKIPITTYTTEATTYPIVTETVAKPLTTKTTANPDTNSPSQTTTETPVTIYTTIITTIHHPDKPLTTTEAHYGQTLENIPFHTPEYDEENGDKPKDLIPHIHIFDSNEAPRRNQSEGPRPEKVIKHVETDGFVGDLTKIVSDEDPDVNKTATDTDEPKSNNTLSNENTLGIQPPYEDSKENKTKLDEEFQKLLELLKEPTKYMSGYDTPYWKPYNAQTPIHSDGIVLIDDSPKTPALKIPGQLSHYTSGFIDSHERTTVSSLEPEHGANHPLNLQPLWTLLVADEQNSIHQKQANTTYVHEHSSLFNAQLHSAEILKNITSFLSNSGYIQLPNADYLEAPHSTEYNQSVATVYPEATNPPKYTDNTQSDFPQTEANIAFTDYTKSGNIDFGQNETNSANADNTVSQSQSNPFYTDYTQSANTDLSQAGSNSDFTGYAELANSDYLHTGTDAINIEHTQSENVNHLTDLSPHYGHTPSGNMELSQVGSNPHYTGNIQSTSDDFSQTASNSQYADYTQSANTDFSNYAAIQSANAHYSQTQPYPQHADYTQTSDKDVSHTGINSAYSEHSQSANSDLPQAQLNSNYADYAQTGSNVDYTGYTQSESTNYSLTGTSSTFIDYTQAASSSFSESHTHPLHTDYTQSGAKDFSQTETNSDYTGNIQSANTDYTQTGANSAYSNYAYTEHQVNPFYAHYLQSAGVNSYKRKPHYFGHRQILHKPNYQTSRKLYKGQKANKIRDRLHKNKWIEYQDYTGDSNPQINNGPSQVHTEIENDVTNSPNLAQINNYIQLAHECPVCFKTIYNELQKKELTEHLDPNDVAMLQLFKKILLYSYIQAQSQQRHSSHGTQSGLFQNHLGVLDSQLQNLHQKPIQKLPSDSTNNDPGIINLQFQQELPILSKSTIQNQHTQSQKNKHNHQVPVDTAETILEEGETESVSKEHMARLPKIQLFNEENLRNVLSAIEIYRKTRQDKYSLKLYAILKLLFDVGKAYTSDGNDASWFGQLPLNTRNSILRYLHHLVKLPWLQELMLQLYQSNNNLDILRNPIWRSHLATWRTPKVLQNANVKFDTNYSNDHENHENYQEVTVNTQDNGNTILAILKSYIRSPEFNSSVGSAEYYQKQNKVLGQIAMYLKQKGYEMNFIEIMINKLHGALNRHVKKTQP